MLGELTLTGKPGGVGLGRNSELWLKDGDVVGVSLEGVGIGTDKVEYESEQAGL